MRSISTLSWPRGLSAKEEPLRRGILIVDIEGFGRPSRTDPLRSFLLKRLDSLLDEALEAAEIPQQTIELRHDLGDGLLFLIDPHVSVARLLHPFISELAAQLARANRHSTDATRIRLRVGIHDGQVLADTSGRFTGAAVIHAFRLVDSEATHTVLESIPDADMALVVSHTVWQSVVSQEYPGIDPAGFRPVAVHAKETVALAWVHVPGQRRQPSLSSMPGLRETGAGPLPIPVSDSFSPVPRAPSTSQQLPPGIAHFTGRKRELAHLRALLAEEDDRPPVVLTGGPGVGKTTLAIHLARALAPRFPDGQLYVDLHGYEPERRVTPGHVLGRFLSALGVAPEAMPTTVDARAALYRGLLASRHALVVLDNASCADQLQPLLPGSPTCAVLVTSRNRLADFIAQQGARPFPLERFMPEEAIELLSRLAGSERVAGEPEATAEVTGYCGYLPLALGIAGAKLASRPTLTVAALAERLRNERHRLEELTVGGVGVRASFTLSYRALDARTARVFRRLPLIIHPNFGSCVAAVLAEITSEEAGSRLEALVDAHLLEAAATPGRYQVPDVVRLYARACLEADDTPNERDGARRRMLDWYADRIGSTDLALSAADDHGPSGRKPAADGCAHVARWPGARVSTRPAPEGREAERSTISRWRNWYQRGRVSPCLRSNSR